MLFLRIISWKGASRFNGGVCFSDGCLHFQMGGMSHGEGFGFGGRGGFRKKIIRWGVPPMSPRLWETLVGGCPMEGALVLMGGVFKKNHRMGGGGAPPCLPLWETLYIYIHTHEYLTYIYIHTHVHVYKHTIHIIKII